MIFERVVVGIDGSPAAMLALRLARLLKVADGQLLALTVAEVHFAAHAGWDAPEWDRRLRADASSASLAAERELHGDAGATAQVVTGYAAPALLRAIDDFNADLVAVGSHGHSRAAGIILGSVATQLIHDAPCSVLVAHGDSPIEGFPRSIAVGIDASATSLEAEALAEALGAATGACVRHLIATGGRRLPEDVALRAELDARAPVDALVDASKSSDLLIVGSRGLHGLAALGSVAERVAHEALCPVLIVRPRGETDCAPVADSQSRRPDAVVP
jgi:nucleotide-binding universal stress UspA family protein